MTPDNLSAENYNSLRQVFSCIDNTTLEGSDTHNRVEQLCRRSMELVDAGRGIGPVAAVCVYPVFVQQARTLLQGSGIRVASVAGAFPAGQSPYPSSWLKCSMLLIRGLTRLTWLSLAAL
jgi:deoxyribose-phosphate aldolase